jgi:hypothetical protein
MAAINSNQIHQTPLHGYFADKADDVVPIICSYLDDDQIGAMIPNKKDSVRDKIDGARAVDHPFLKACSAIVNPAVKGEFRQIKAAAIHLLELDSTKLTQCSYKELQQIADKIDKAARLEFARFFAIDSQTKKKVFSAKSTDDELETWLKEKLSDPKAMDAQELVSVANSRLSLLTLTTPFSVILSPKIHPTHLMNLFIRSAHFGQPIDLFELNPVWKRIEKDQESYQKMIWTVARNLEKDPIPYIYKLVLINKISQDWPKSYPMPKELTDHLNQIERNTNAAIIQNPYSDRSIAQADKIEMLIAQADKIEMLIEQADKIEMLIEQRDQIDIAPELEFARVYARDPNTRKRLFSKESTAIELEQWLEENLSDPKAMDAEELVSVVKAVDWLNPPPTPSIIILSPKIHPTHLRSLFIRSARFGQPINSFKRNPVWKRIEKDQESYQKMIQTVARNLEKDPIPYDDKLVLIHNIFQDWPKSYPIPKELSDHLNQIKKEIHTRRQGNPYRDRPMIQVDP